MEKLSLTYGPELEETMITAGLDYYKLTMGQLQFEKHEDKEVTFTFKNRGEQRLLDYVDPDELQTRLDQIRQAGWSQAELDYIGSLKRSNGEAMFSANYLNFLGSNELPEVSITVDKTTNDLAVDTTGKWPLVTFWETVIMNQISEMYFSNYVRENNIDIEELYQQGDRNLDEWVEYLKANPDVKAAEFGTRRRFSTRWQKHVVERFNNECPDNLIGTSNVGLAKTLGLTAVGTFAHEMPMVYAAIADAEERDVRQSHNEMLRDWEEMYSPDLLTALSDTFTSDFFYQDFQSDQAEAWNGPRHDSGDPLEFTDKTVSFYKEKDVDPELKTIMFSDSLNKTLVSKLHQYTRGRINDRYGIGTNWTNNLGLKALNIVMKATEVRLADGRTAKTVKLSDDKGKHVGPDELAKKYEQQIFNVERKDQDECTLTTV